MIGVIALGVAFLCVNYINCECNKFLSISGPGGGCRVASRGNVASRRGPISAIRDAITRQLRWLI